MPSIKKLTPQILKRIIAEEKQKLKLKKKNSEIRKESIVETNEGEKRVNAISKLALREAKLMLEAKKLRIKRNRIKRSLSIKTRG